MSKKNRTQNSSTAPLSHDCAFISELDDGDKHPLIIPVPSWNLKSEHAFTKIGGEIPDEKPNYVLRRAELYNIIVR